jgi:hypothetical protein
MVGLEEIFNVIDPLILFVFPVFADYTWRAAVCMDNFAEYVLV